MKNVRSQVARSFSRLFTLLLICLALSAPVFPQAQAAPQIGPGLAPIEHYIANAWDTLTRSMSECSSIVDPKIKAAAVLYLPADFAAPPAVEKLHSACNVQIEHLPKVLDHLGEIDTTRFQPQGLLYLPNKYVVPGGRFNEMYGWDSYFIIRGLVRAGRIDLAKDMVDNFFFEIEHYGGAMLNANRTYYLTRSQPPYLSSMVMSVYEAQKQAGHADKAWLARAYSYLNRDYALWVREPHLAGDTGLSRYYDFGDGPPAEAVQDESGFYRKAVMYFLLHGDSADHYLVEHPADSQEKTLGMSYSVSVCDIPTTMARPECEAKRAVSLSADYYKGDRSMRESGFDVSFRFGPFSAATHHYAPVCLNSLLYKTETDLAQIAEVIGKGDEAVQWKARAEARKQAMNQYLWSPQWGRFVDYDFQNGVQSSYVYAAMFYPMWAGVATAEQAAAIMRHLGSLEEPGGIAMSTYESGAQWDFPFGWAPMQLVGVEGMRKYGFNREADRVSMEFLSMVKENFRKEGTIHEKYDVVARSWQTKVEAGYQINVVGFGWTNGVFLELLHQLPKAEVEQLEKE